MQAPETTIDFETLLTDERPRLVRLCAWFSGSQEAAEDLAQETLIAAWRSREQLVSLDKLKPWTSAIARNVCLHWSRRHYREQARVASLDEDESLEDHIEAETDIELELDRYELARVLDQALALLPKETAQMLVEHYIQDSSHAEIADRLKMNPGAVAVRLQRGKLTLQKLLRTDLSGQASAFGLIDPLGSQWEETNIWCPGCGQARLLGKFQKSERFALRCPHCHPDPETYMAGLDLTKPYHARLLGNTRMYKPAYVRLITAFAPLYQQALRTNSAPCLACGQPVEVRVERDARRHKPAQEISRVTLYCPACEWASNKTLSGLVLSLPESQRFWREHPRLRILPDQEIEVDGAAAYLTRLQSVTSTAELAVISQRDTFEPIQVHTNIKL